MPKSKNFLPDVNVWLALASRRHVHAGSAAAWLGSIVSGDVIFCRVTQMGLLRLLTNPKVMGTDVLSQLQAWRVYDRMLSDPRMDFSAEPSGLEKIRRPETRSARDGHRVWTDSYLSAFAQSSEMRLVSFDKVFATGEMKFWS